MILSGHFFSYCLKCEHQREVKRKDSVLQHSAKESGARKKNVPHAFVTLRFSFSCFKKMVRKGSSHASPHCILLLFHHIIQPALPLFLAFLRNQSSSKISIQHWHEGKKKKRRRKELCLLITKRLISSHWESARLYVHSDLQAHRKKLKMAVTSCEKTFFAKCICINMHLVIKEACTKVNERRVCLAASC